MKRKRIKNTDMPTGNTIDAVLGPQSEEARNNDDAGVETDPILDKIARSRGIDLKNLLKTLKRHPDELTDDEQRNIIDYSSAFLPKAMER